MCFQTDEIQYTVGYSDASKPLLHDGDTHDPQFNTLREAMKFCKSLESDVNLEEAVAIYDALKDETATLFYEDTFYFPRKQEEIRRVMEGPGAVYYITVTVRNGEDEHREDIMVKSTDPLLAEAYAIYSVAWNPNDLEWASGGLIEPSWGLIYDNRGYPSYKIHTSRPISFQDAAVVSMYSTGVFHCDTTLLLNSNNFNDAWYQIELKRKAMNATAEEMAG